MKILLSFNDAYAPHAAAVITGLIRHSSQKLSVVVLYYDLSEETRDKLYKYYAERLLSFEFVKADLAPNIIEKLQTIRTQFYLKSNIDTWLRLFASSHLSDDYVVWLDCDIVITDDICKILEEVDDKYCVSACKEYDPLYKLKDVNACHEAFSEDFKYLMSYEAHYFRTYEYYGLPHNVSYLSAGIMYMNLKKWRETHLESRIVEKLLESDYAFALDQDILNSVLKGQFGILSPKWNTAILCRRYISNYDSSLLQEAELNPCIVHLGGAAKPWNEQFGGLYRKMYWDYRLDTPWPARPHWKRRLKNKYKIVNFMAKTLYRLKSFVRPQEIHPLVANSFMDANGQFLKK